MSVECLEKIKQQEKKINHRCNEVFDVVQTLLWYLPWDLAGACCCMKCWLSGSSSHKGFVGIFSPGSILSLSLFRYTKIGQQHSVFLFISIFRKQPCKRDGDNRNRIGKSFKLTLIFYLWGGVFLVLKMFCLMQKSLLPPAGILLTCTALL